MQLLSFSEESLFSPRGRSRHVHRFSGGRYSDPQRVAEYIQIIETELRASIVMCPNALFVFDEVHLMARGVIDRLLPYMDVGASVDKVSYTSAIFLLVSNLGARVLNAAFLQSIAAKQSLPAYETIVGNLRAYFVQTARAPSAPSSPQTPPTSESTSAAAAAGTQVAHHASSHVLNTASAAASILTLVQQHVLWFVPFFPLMRAHVEQCLEQQLIERLDKQVEARRLHSFGIHADLVRWLGARAELDARGLSISGCKQVDGVLTTKVFGVILAQNRPTNAGAPPQKKDSWWSSVSALLGGLTAVPHTWSRSHVSLYPPLGWAGHEQEADIVRIVVTQPQAKHAGADAAREKESAGKDREL